MDLQLDGRTALVTGSTAGIGLAIAARLAAEGAHVVIPGRSREKLDAAVAHIERAHPGTAARVRTVLANPADAAGATLLARELPDVDILVNNLGIYESKAFGDVSDEDWRKFFEVNVLSGARLARQYLPGMMKRNWGRIIFIASDSALVIPPDMIHYGMTKSAQLSISRGLAATTKGTRVTVNAVLPGTTRSEGIGDFFKSVASNPNAPMAEIEAEFFKKERPTSLLQRVIEAEEIAALVAFVASPLSSATNGAALRADGGVVPTIA
ncbi:3-oxoacyl-[acyl-carrier protein] reductase [Myxococcus hansupus]|uniref:3-oxoacyl-[acyl-carrier protein] reductase n=1 Tax=Pseudomyxococcus hansupus TaxID=1297742 RepID=A0A0H4WSR8_9BACT|nr:SDR family oxidoreductase [Myxococcus hansupus]AKQ65859.1 3-oxoacyl-[acyl-carrier protein] reductase [Myxococcus hansupus]